MFFQHCRRSVAVGLALVASLALAGPARAQTEPAPRKLIVGTKEAAPFSIKNRDGTWGGISIDLWREIASELQLDYDLREMELTSLLEGLANGFVDVAVAALTVTEDREKAFDFSHSFYIAGLGIAVKSGGGGRWVAVLGRVFSLEFAALIGVLLLVLLLVGFLVWIFERRRNSEEFGGRTAKGLGSAVWWSAVTMTTVGYGDKAPKTSIGRILAVIWMFAGIILISFFTAAVTSTLTVSELSSIVRGPEDLPRVKVATVSGTTSEQYLLRQRIRHRSFATPRAALDALASGAFDAVIYDAPILRYLVASAVETPVRVLPTMFERQHYAIGLASDSPLRERINRVLLRHTNEASWERILQKYLGE